MSFDKNLLLSKVTGPHVTEEMRRAKALIADEDTRPVSERVGVGPVSEVLSIWGTRLKNTAITGKEILGLRDLVSRLHSLGDATKLEQFGFSGPRSAGSLFFEHGTDEFVGLVAVTIENAKPPGFKAPRGWDGKRIS
jgi:hypothetical protein